MATPAGTREGAVVPGARSGTHYLLFLKLSKEIAGFVAKPAWPPAVGKEAALLHTECCV